MGLLAWIRKNKRKEEREIQRFELERAFIQEKQEQRLEFEKRKREIELSTIEKRAELEKAKLEYDIKDHQARIQEDFGDDEEEESDSSDINNMMAGLLGGILTKSDPQQAQKLEQQTTLQTPVMASETSGLVEFSDEEIKIILSSIDKKYLKMAKLMPDSTIKQLIKSKYANISEDSLNRAIVIVKANI